MAEPNDPTIPDEPVPSHDPGPSPVVSHWSPIESSSVPEAPRPPSRFTRVLEAVAWIVGTAAVLFFGRVLAFVNASPPLTPYEAGRALGPIVFAVLIGAFVRWLVVRVRRRGRTVSPWILVVAVLVLVINLGNREGLGAPAEFPLDSYLKIDAPYALTAPTADETTQFGEALKGAADSYEVRRVLESDQLVGFLIVADVKSRSSPDWDGLERGFESKGGTAERVVIGTRDAIVGKVPSGASVLWIEAPYLLTITAVDEESARALAESVMAGYED